jgi:hypothetical protein
MLVVTIALTGVMKSAYADSSNLGFTANSREEDSSTNDYGVIDLADHLSDAVDMGKWMLAGVTGWNGFSALSGGAAMMTGLAGAGGVVGGGAVAGIGVLGTAPVIAA